MVYLRTDGLVPSVVDGLVPSVVDGLIPSHVRKSLCVDGDIAPKPLGDVTAFVGIIIGDLITDGIIIGDLITDGIIIGDLTADGIIIGDLTTVGNIEDLVADGVGLIICDNGGLAADDNGVLITVGALVDVGVCDDTGRPAPVNVGVTGLLIKVDAGDNGSKYDE